MAKPIKLRSLFIPPEGYSYVAADLSQAETWVVAHLAEEPNMKWSLMNSDIHTDTAFGLFNEGSARDHKWESEGKGKVCSICGLPIVETERYIGKQNNHANSYGMLHNRQAEVINKQSDKPPYVTVSVDQCKVFQSKWHNLYPNVRGIYHAEIQFQLNGSRVLITPYGYKRTFFGFLDDQLYKAAYAHIPQSTVAQHFSGKVQRELGIEGGLRGIRADLPRNSKIVNMSHDSLVVETPDDMVQEIATLIHDNLSRPMVIKGEIFTIPVDVEVGKSYGSTSKWKGING